MLRHVAVLLAAALSAAGQSGPVNLDFEKGELKFVPAGWHSRNALAETTTDSCFHGRCARMTYTPSGLTSFANLMQSFDAAAYRGKVVRLHAAVRTDGIVRAQMWLRVDREHRVIGFFDNMQDRPILSKRWAEYDITGNVDPDATRINFGVMVLQAAGRAWVDDVRFDVVGPIGESVPVEAARQLTGRGLENLVAFARLFGYVRHFYPGDGAAKADWDTIAIEGVRAVEGAKDAADLAARLKAIFQPIAPEVRVFLATDKVAESPAIAALKFVRWRHLGFGGGDAQYNPYKSTRVLEMAPGGKVPRPFRFDLAPGVSCMVPLALPASREPIDPGKPPKRRWSADDRAVRLADVAIIWNILEHFYP